MKQSILALGAAAALGFAGAAQAVFVFGPGEAHPSLPEYYDPAAPDTPHQATAGDGLVLAAGHIGNVLFTPYYNVQPGTNTLFNIANTDAVNGKAVKVRFRSAVNSDDVLDFTVLLSPADVWSATVTRDASGNPILKTSDNSCILPHKGEDVGRQQMQGKLVDTATGQLIEGVELSTTNLPALAEDADGLPTEAGRQLMAEGYIEILNMADIPPVEVGGVATNPLYTAIKHVGDVNVGNPPCTAEPLQKLELPLVVDNATAGTNYGLFPPTGGLMGSWTILNQRLVSTYAGNMTAVRLETGFDGFPAYGNVIFSPQSQKEIPLADLATQIGVEIDTQYGPNGAADASVGGMTGDPLLSTTDPIQKPLWFDLPDMSTPLVAGILTPQDQVMGLQLAKHQIFNSYISGEVAGIPMWTDWVVSQPTRRYYAAMSYEGATTSTVTVGAGGLVWNATMGSPDPTNYADGVADAVTTAGPVVSDNVYGVLEVVQGDNLNPPKTGMGPYACLPSEIPLFGAVDHEEWSSGAPAPGSSAGFSPGRPAKVDRSYLCGEVFVVGFAKDSVFNAYTTRMNWPQKTAKLGNTGMANIAFGELKVGGTATAFPVVGFGATSLRNLNNGKNYGMTVEHSWN